MKKWEYKFFCDNDEDLNALGKEGWELVSVVYESYEDTRQGGTSSRIILYLKRELN
jgi:hypothetical protein